MSDADLIECVQQFDVIWEKNNKDHKNKIIVQNAWKAIGAALNLTPQICEQRFANIRNRYAKERRKLQNCTRSGAGAYEVQWSHYSACSFLDKVIMPRKRTTNYELPALHATTDAEDSETITVEDVFNDTQADSAELTLNDVYCNRNNAELPLHTLRTTNAIPPTPSTSKTSSIYTTPGRTSSSSTSYSSGELTDSHRQNLLKSRKTSKTEDIDNIAKSITGAINKFDEMLSKSSHPDEGPLELSDVDYAFGRTVALSLRSINSVKRKLTLKAKIMNLIADATDSD